MKAESLGEYLKKLKVTTILKKNEKNTQDEEWINERLKNNEEKLQQIKERKNKKKEKERKCKKKKHI